jgi:hypothetical protein
LYSDILQRHRLLNIILLSQASNGFISSSLSKINIRENRKANQQWFNFNYFIIKMTCEMKNNTVCKRQRKPKCQSKIDNLEAFGTRHKQNKTKTKQKKKKKKKQKKQSKKQN